MTSRSEAACGRCRSCHPGKQFGGDSFCRNRDCGCHRGIRPVSPNPFIDPIVPIAGGSTRGNGQLAQEAIYDGWGRQ